MATQTEPAVEIITDPWAVLLKERMAHQATLDLLGRYIERAQELNGDGFVLKGRCKLCSAPRGGIANEYRATCPCQTSREYCEAENARLAKEPRRGKKLTENLFAPPAQTDSSTQNATAETEGGQGAAAPATFREASAGSGE